MNSLTWTSLGRVDSRVVALAVGVLAFASAVANTRFDAPPRFDGAGYATLGRSLAQGSGYREINHPDSPRHGHFPPGYPLALAVVFRALGPSAAAARAFSLACTTAAVMATFWWLRRLYALPVAALLAMALAVNWTWGRTGGAIQSEPLFFLLSALALNTAGGPRDRAGPGRAIVLGMLLGACILTRHVGICLATALLADLVLRRRLAAAAAAAMTTAACVAPWVGWLAHAGRGSQARLIAAEGWWTLIPAQLLFCAQRLPDQIVGPFVEIATVYVRDRRLALAATACAVTASALLVWGWLRLLRTERRRAAGLVPLFTLALLLVWPFTEAGRFLIPLVPFLLLAAVESLAPLLARVRLHHPRRGAALVVLAISLPYALYSIASGRADAQRRTHDAFNAACARIGRDASRPGPILCRYPADVFWQTGRRSLEPGSEDTGSIGRLVDRYGVAYLLVEDRPYSNAAADPVARFVSEQPERVRRVWGRPGAVIVYEIVSPSTR